MYNSSLDQVRRVVRRAEVQRDVEHTGDGVQDHVASLRGWEDTVD